MKNKFLMALALIVAATGAGAGAAWVVGAAENHNNLKTTTEATSVPGFEGAGAQFTTYTPQNYPDLTYAAENAVKAVVGVIKIEEVAQRQQMNPFFEFFGVPEGYEEYYGRGSKPLEQRSGGSGVIISSDGYIVTNHHVVVNASKLTVKLPDGKTYDARLVGTDADTEVALLKIEATGLPSIPFGSSDALRLGEWVLAIGNPFNLRSTITAGIVSAKARSLGAIETSSSTEAFIQTDAAVNPGNSGGALVNTAGQLVGINTLLVSPTQTYAGYSFAIPETIVRKVVADLREFGLVQRAIIGISYVPVDEEFIEQMGDETGITETGGIYVSEALADGAARAAGIRKGDVITSIDGVTITDAASLAEVIGQKRPGDVVKISAKRGSSVKQFDVVLRNKAGKSELLPAGTQDAARVLGGELRAIDLSNKQKRELGIDGGVQVTSVGNGLLARAGVRRGYIITHINGREIVSENDIHRVTDKITSIEGIYPNGRAVTYSFAPSEENSNK
jgi:Do/DeqQ family serine protease